MASKGQLKAAELLAIEAFASTPMALVGALVARETLADLRSVADEFNKFGAEQIGPAHGQWSQPSFEPDGLATLFTVRYPPQVVHQPPWPLQLQHAEPQECGSAARREFTLDADAAHPILQGGLAKRWRTGRVRP